MKNCFLSIIFFLITFSSLLAEVDLPFWHLLDSNIGLLSCGSSSSFISLWDLAPNKGGGIRIATIGSSECGNYFKEDEHFLSLAKIEEDRAYFDFDQLQGGALEVAPKLNLELEEKVWEFKKILLHDYVIYQLIKQIAPLADILFIPCFKNNGYASKEDFLKSLKISDRLKPDILHLGLRFNVNALGRKNHKVYKKINKLIHKSNYTVAASGNKESYLENLQNITFDVGSYEKKEKKLVVSSFSQYKKNVGPKVVAPGSNLAYRIKDKIYLASGTSFSSAIIAAFLSLVLSEFKNKFTKNEIIFIILRSTYKPYKNKDWSNKTLFGIIDMKKSMLCFHALNYIQAKIPKKIYKKKFKKLVKKTYSHLQEQDINFNLAFNLNTWLSSFCKNLRCYAHCAE